MQTKYAKNVDLNCPLNEYPRPQLKRDNWLCLNGPWDCAFTDAPEQPASYDKKIIVPFSPETELSGVGRSLKPDEYLWYRRTVELPSGTRDKRFLLHFGAVDQIAAVYVNGSLTGVHMGGYTSFEIDITSFIIAGTNEIVVMVSDETDRSWQSRGKQKTNKGGIFYTPQSGIWQTVWLEAVPQTYIKNLRILPLFDQGSLSVTINTNNPCTVQIGAMGVTAKGDSGKTVILKLPESWQAWSPENPKLYDLYAKAGDDEIASYFGMRKFAVDTDENGVKRLFLNGKPYFHTGVLDQGYYADTLLTPPCDQAMEDDLRLMKDMGFNCIRKHIKQEPLRWYYHCDKLGLLVWQDMVNGGGPLKNLTALVPAVFAEFSLNDSNYSLFSRESEEGRKQYYRELGEMLDTLYNCPCIAMWVPFNEGWGQFDSAKAVEFIKERDTSRTIDHASGWHDQHIGDIKSLHIYRRPYKFKKDRLGRAVLLTEFGGYTYRVPDHFWSEKTFGYHGCENSQALLDDFTRLYENEIIAQKPLGLAASIYTQLSDVEEEDNGLITFDREVVKLPVEAVRALNDKLKDHPQQ